MKTSLMRSLLTGAALLLGGINAQAETYTWSNGGNSTLWGTSGNWVGSPALTFNSTTDVVFDNASVVFPSNTVSIQGAKTIRSLTINANYATSTNATFDIRTNNAANPANLTFEAASGNASITVAESTSGTAQVRLGQNTLGNVVLNSNLDLSQNNTFFGPVGFQFESAISGNGTINKSGAGLVRVLRVNSGWSGGMNINEGNVAVSVQPGAMGAGAWTLGGGSNNTTLSFGANVTYNNAGGIVVAAGAGTRTIQNDSNSVGNFTLGNVNGTIDLSAGKDLTFNVTANGAADTMTIASNITGTGGVVKSGNGTLTLGNSTYTGDTTVLAGTLAVNGSSIGDSQKLIIDGGKVAPTGTENVGTLFFGAAQQAAGTWGSSASAATLPFQDDTRFSGTGVVVVASGGGSLYTTWANSFGLQDPWLGVDPALNGTTTADPDNDGVTNLEEYAFGLIPTSGSSVSPIKVQLNQSTGLFTYTRRKPSLTLLTYAYEYSTTLSGAWLPFTPDSTSTNSGDPIEEIIVDVPNSLLTNTKLFVRVTAQ